MNCLSCSAVLNESFDFCQSCNKEIVVFPCSNCGYPQNRIHYKWCKKCNGLIENNVREIKRSLLREYEDEIHLLEKEIESLSKQQNSSSDKLLSDKRQKLENVKSTIKAIAADQAHPAIAHKALLSNCDNIKTIQEQAKTQSHESSAHSGSIIAAIIWMVVISILLFWLPILGPLIAGFVGGRKAGSLGNALMAVFIPSVLVGILFFVFASALSGLPLIGALAGGSALILSLTGIGPLLIGAILGGVTA